MKEKSKVIEPVVIERAHRIGNEHAKKPRIMRFLDYNDRQTVNLHSSLMTSHERSDRLNSAWTKRLLDTKHKAANGDVWVTYTAKLFVGGKFIREEPVITEHTTQRKSDNCPVKWAWRWQKPTPRSPWRQSSGGGPHHLDGHRREREWEQLRSAVATTPVGMQNADYRDNRRHGGRRQQKS